MAERRMNYSNSLCEFYTKADADNKYEHRWGYINPTAAAYWRMRDELVFENITRRWNTYNPSLKILEIGVGHGHELTKMTQLGICESQLTGIDLVLERLEHAKSTYPALNLSCQDGVQLAFGEESFDIVFQITCVMHAPTKEIQSRICQEIVRVLKPGGIVIWWDVAPTQWRTLALRRNLKMFSDKKMEKAFSVIMDLVAEALIPSRRRKALSKSFSSYLLPVSKQEIIQMFPGFVVHAKYAGVDFDIWEYLWKRNRTLAQIIWRTGWFWQHCFAVIEKPKV